MRPVHEMVQSTVLGDDLDPGAQHQVEGIAEHDLGAEPLEFLGGHRLDGAVGPHRHERRGLHRTVGERQPTAAGGAIAGQQFERGFQRIPLTNRQGAAGTLRPRARNIASP